jgi:hypothetical protein
VVETITGSLTGATSNERAETLERVTAWTGRPACAPGARRPFDYDFGGGVVVDEITLGGPVQRGSGRRCTNPHFGNKTTIHTITRANRTPRRCAGAS